MIALIPQLEPELRRWLPTQRWFQGKDRDVVDVSVADAATLGSVLVVIARVAYDDHPPDRYQVLLAPHPEGPLRFDGRRWRDALADPEAVRLLADLSCQPERTPTAAGGQITGAPVGGHRPPPGAEVRPLGAEQSNTSVVLGGRWILKVLRRLEAGTHPDIELTAVLTDRGFPHIPAQHGSLQLVCSGEAASGGAGSGTAASGWPGSGAHWPGEADTGDVASGEPTALAVLSEFAQGAEEGWALATAEAPGTPARPGRLRANLPALGQAVADLHLTLADALGARPAGEGERRQWEQAMRSQLDRVLGAAARLAPEETAEVRRRADDIRAVLARVGSLADAGAVSRIHGDLHLGQVLLTPDDRWLLLDFEGEPVRPLGERRAAGSPLRDVAGMLRSFDYAAAGRRSGKVDVAAATWRDDARQRFLDGYVPRATALLPPEPDARALLAAWELDKAVYELGYELANRPDWVPIPAEGILRILG